MNELDEILDSAQSPNPDNPRHVEAMLALLGRLATPDDARAVCAQAQREGRSFRQLATLAERALVGSEWAYSRWDRFLRRAFGEGGWRR
jgi:hypothetical protein